MNPNKSPLESLELLDPEKLNAEFPERRQQSSGATQERRVNPQKPSAAASARIAAMLEKAQMFKDLDWSQIEALSGYIELYRASPGGVLFREGDRGDFMCIVLQGKLEVHKENTRHVDKTVSTVYAGRSLGEMTIVDGEPRSATAVAIEPSILAVLTQQNFLLIMREKPSLSAKLLLKIAQLLSQRLRLTSGILVDYLES
ncbi:MAG: cyclic nucleotide-binding domain-containing protein [Nitrosomonadales bacterium]|nr:cyclic nucleotide-binding domain-containing protein [Nitrosomonadales bacterium]